MKIQSFQTTQDTFVFKPILVDWIAKYKKDVAKLYQKSYKDPSNFVIDSLVLNNLYQTYEEPLDSRAGLPGIFDW